MILKRTIEGQTKYRKPHAVKLLACVAGRIVSTQEIKFWQRSQQASGEAARRMRRGTLKYRLQENHRISNGPHTENRLVERSTQVNQMLDEHSYISQGTLLCL